MCIRDRPPKDDEVPIWSAKHRTKLPPLAAIEHGDNFADCSPPGMARSCSDLLSTALNCPPQQPSK
eukprot:7773000-Pyramimonas_sp.AAC.1